MPRRKSESGYHIDMTMSPSDSDDDNVEDNEFDNGDAELEAGDDDFDIGPGEAIEEVLRLPIALYFPHILPIHRISSEECPFTATHANGWPCFVHSNTDGGPCGMADTLLGPRVGTRWSWHALASWFTTFFYSIICPLPAASELLGVMVRKHRQPYINPGIPFKLHMLSHEFTHSQLSR